MKLWVRFVNKHLLFVYIYSYRIEDFTVSSLHKAIHIISPSIGTQLPDKFVFNSFGAIGDYSRPSGRPLLSTLVDMTLCNDVIKTAS